MHRKSVYLFLPRIIAKVMICDFGRWRDVIQDIAVTSMWSPMSGRDFIPLSAPTSDPQNELKVWEHWNAGDFVIFGDEWLSEWRLQLHSTGSRWFQRRVFPGRRVRTKHKTTKRTYALSDRKQQKKHTKTDWSLKNMQKHKAKPTARNAHISAYTIQFSDNLPSCPPDNHHSSYAVERDRVIMKTRRW